jgi:hypothetical protein
VTAFAPALAELALAREAEDFFEALEVPFDPRVLEAHRLLILRRFSLAVAALERARPRPQGPEVRRALREALREAHELAAGRADVPLTVGPGARLVQLGRGG